jgi:hypothetical protein
LNPFWPLDSDFEFGSDFEPDVSILGPRGPHLETDMVAPVTDFSLLTAVEHVARVNTRNASSAPKMKKNRKNGIYLGTTRTRAYPASYLYLLCPKHHALYTPKFNTKVPTFIFRTRNRKPTHSLIAVPHKPRKSRAKGTFNTYHNSAHNSYTPVQPSKTSVKKGQLKSPPKQSLKSPLTHKQSHHIDPVSSSQSHDLTTNNFMTNRYCTMTFTVGDTVVRELFAQNADSTNRRNETLHQFTSQTLPKHLLLNSHIRICAHNNVTFPLSVSFLSQFRNETIMILPPVLILINNNLQQHLRVFYAARFTKPLTFVQVQASPIAAFP